MKNNISFLTTIVGLALIYLCSLSSCVNDMKEIQRLTLQDTISGQYINEGEMIYSENAIVKVRLKSPIINSFETSEAYIEMPKGFYAEFFGDSTEIESTITAEYGIFYTDKKLMTARRNVIVYSLKDSVTLNTEELIWDQNEHKIYSNVFVKITEPGKILLGDGFESEEDFSQRKILKLRGEIIVEDENL